jgi:hypothetical protein
MSLLRMTTASPAGTLPPCQVAGALHNPPPFPLLRTGPACAATASNNTGVTARQMRFRDTGFTGLAWMKTRR